MIAKSAKSLHRPLKVNSLLVCAIGFFITALVHLNSQRVTESLTSMNMFVITTTCLIITTGAAFISSLLKDRKAQTFQIPNGHKIIVSAFGGASLLSLFNWFVVAIQGVLSRTIVGYEVVLGIVGIIAVLLHMYASNVQIFGINLWIVIDCLTAGATMPALFLLLFDESLLKNPIFPMLYLFATIPSLLLGIVLYRDTFNFAGIVLCGPFALGLIDWLLQALGVFSYQQNLIGQLMILGVIFFIRLIVFRVLIEF